MISRRSTVANINRFQNEENIQNLSIEEMTFKYQQLFKKHTEQLLKTEQMTDTSHEQREQIKLLQTELKAMSQLKQQMQTMKTNNQYLEDQKEQLQQQNEIIKLQLNLHQNQDQNILENSVSNISLSGFQFRKEIYEKELQIQQYILQVKNLKDQCQKLDLENKLHVEEIEKYNQIINEQLQLNEVLKCDTDNLKTQLNSSAQLITQLKHQIENIDKQNHDPAHENHLHINSLFKNGIIIEEYDDYQSNQSQNVQNIESFYQTNTSKQKNNKDNTFQFYKTLGIFLYFRNRKQLKKLTFVIRR